MMLRLCIIESCCRERENGTELEGSAVYQSFTNRTHRYVNVKNGGTWSGWGLITVA